MECLTEESAVIAMEELGKEQVSFQEELNGLRAEHPVDNVDSSKPESSMMRLLGS
jgi:hypothetical protein